MTQSIRLIRGKIPLLLALLWYLLASLPYLADYPAPEAAEIGIAAPAYKLAETGVYGNDLYTGFYRTEELNYEYMPLYPLFVALAYKLLGLGLWQGRLVSVLAGLGVLLLTYRLGRRLFNERVGLLATWFLAVLRLGYDWQSSGIPLVEMGRIIRYDIFVPLGVLAACLAFLWAGRQQRAWGYCLAGFFAGLATLSHVYGAFVLPLLALLFIWEQPREFWRRPGLYLLGSGWLLALLPWGLYVAGDPAAYRGQMLRHGARFDFLNPAFYWQNFIQEPLRYLNWIGPELREPALWPRAGIYLLAAGLLLANLLLLRRLRRGLSGEERLLWLSLPVLFLQLALLVSFKRYPYVVLLLPFMALQLGWVVDWLWKWGRERRMLRSFLALLLALILLEGGLGVLRSQRAAAATMPYEALTGPIVAAIPSGARVLSQHPYWIGLAGYEVRLIDLAFVLSDPRYGYEPAPTMAAVIDELTPDYIVLDDNLLQSGLTPEYAQLNPPIAAQWQAFNAYLADSCPQLVDEIVADDYGRVVIYRCR